MCKTLGERFADMLCNRMATLETVVRHLLDIMDQDFSDELYLKSAWGGLSKLIWHNLVHQLKMKIGLLVKNMIIVHSLLDCGDVKKNPGPGLCSIAALFWRILPKDGCKGDELLMSSLHPSHAGVILNRLTPCFEDLSALQMLTV